MVEAVESPTYNAFLDFQVEGLKQLSECYHLGLIHEMIKDT